MAIPLVDFFSVQEKDETKMSLQQTGTYDSSQVLKLLKFHPREENSYLHTKREQKTFVNSPP
jgi:hypothetical protein